MEKELLFMLMEENIKVNLKMMKNMDKDFIKVLVEGSERKFGKMDNLKIMEKKNLMRMIL